jgi:ketosteroid isomerase-like protein
VSQEHELIALSEAWMQAIVSNDAKAIEPYMADEWLLVTIEAGPVKKQQFLGAIESGALVHDAMGSVGEPIVRLYGDSAVLVQHVQNRGSYDGQSFSYDEWSTDTYVRVDGRWRCVITALTPGGSPQGS